MVLVALCALRSCEVAQPMPFSFIFLFSEICCEEKRPSFFTIILTHSKRIAFATIINVSTNNFTIKSNALSSQNYNKFSYLTKKLLNIRQFGLDFDYSAFRYSSIWVQCLCSFIVPMQNISRAVQRAELGLPNHY